LKKITARVYIVLFITLILILGISFFAYEFIVSGLIDNEISKSLKQITNTIGVSIETNLNDDYNRVYSDINSIIINNGIVLNDDDVNETLEEIIECLYTKYEYPNKLVNKVNYGIVLGEDELEYAFLLYSDKSNSTIYPFHQQSGNEVIFYQRSIFIGYMHRLFNQSVNDAGCIFFRYEIYEKVYLLVYFDSDIYLSGHMSDSNIPLNDHYIVWSDMTINYEQTVGNKPSYYSFVSLLSNNGMNETEINTIDREMRNTISNVKNITLYGKKVFLSYNNILEKYSYYIDPTDISKGKYQFYVVYAYDYDAVRLMNSNTVNFVLVYIMTLLLLVVFSIFISTAVISAKVRDIEVSKLRLYFSKPYIIKITSRGKVRSFNNACKQAFKYTKKVKLLDDIIISASEPDIYNFMRKQRSLVLEVENKEGNRRSIRFLPLADIGGYYLMGEDVTEQIEAIKASNAIAYKNQNTDLPNKAMFESDAATIIAKHKTAEHVNTNSVLILYEVTELDKIGKIFGYKNTNNIMRTTVTMVQMALVDYKYTLYHNYSFCFGIILTDYIDKKMPSNLVTSLLNVFSKPVEYNSNSLKVGVKVGICELEIDLYPNISAVQWYNNAEIALTKAKGSVNPSAIYNIEMANIVSSDLIMERDIKRAIENNEFVVYLQPQFDTVKKRIFGFEGLIRWDNEKYRHISPQKYIDFAEKNDLIIDIGRIIIEQICQIINKLEKYNVEISMNVSSVQFLQSGFAMDLISILNRNKVSHGRLAIEITETVLMENFENIIHKLKQLRSSGVKIHLDDFGIGYSSMFYLKELPIDLIKIDKDFIKYMLNDKATRSIVKKIIEMTASLEIGVIAEGVEIEEQSTFLSKNGCNIIQGYFFSRPIDLDKALDLLAKYNK